MYIIRESHGNYKSTDYYKVGKTKNYTKRIKSLRGGNKRNLKYSLVVRVSDNSKAETAAKKKLIQFHIENLDGGKEWYKVHKHQVETFESSFVAAIEDYKLETVPNHLIKFQ